jgi:hypothetical protein
MDDRTLLDAFYVLAVGIDRVAGPEPPSYCQGMPNYCAVSSRIRALAEREAPDLEIPEELKALVRLVKRLGIVENSDGKMSIEKELLGAYRTLPDHLLRACGIEKR